MRTIRAIFVLGLLLAAGLDGQSISAGALRVEAVPAGATVRIIINEQIVLDLQPVQLDKTSLVYPLKMAVKGDKQTLDLSGAFGQGMFRARIIIQGGIQCHWRYHDQGAGRQFALRIQGPWTGQVTKGPGSNAVDDVRIILNAPLTETADGLRLIREGAAHITAENTGAYINVGIIHKDSPRPVLTALPSISAEPRQNQPVEIGLDLIDLAPNPYLYRRISAEITAPSGRKTILMPFLNQKFKADEGGWTEIDFPYYAFRFLPREAGEYRYMLKAGQRVLHAGTAAVKASSMTGLVGTRKQSRFFHFEDGRVFFPIGMNLCWGGEKGLRYYLDQLADNGMNAGRVWLCTWDLDLEGARVNDFRLDTAARLDDLLQYALQKNIRLMLTINNFHDFTYNRDRHGYFAPRGPCLEKGDYFTDEACLQLRRRFLDYLVSRYASYPSLWAWELWNEVNYAQPREIDIAKTEDPVARHIKTIDPYRHPVTTSLGWAQIDYDLWNLESIDIVQYHSYIPNHTTLPPGSQYLDAARWVRTQIGAFAGLTKPVLFSEIGHKEEGKINPNNQLDPDGVMLHNSIWAGTLAGYGGTPMHWWWDVYIDRNKLFYLYKPLTGLMQEFQFSDTVRPVALENAFGGRLRVMALKDDHNAVFWVQDKRAAWGRIQVQKRVPTPVKGALIKAGRFQKGTYAVKWISTFSGKELSRVVLKTEKGLLTLEIPAFKRDIACLIRKADTQ